MSVYVDPLRIWGGDAAPPCFRHKASCHMYADTLEELHTMAARVGMKLTWFQTDSSLAHYDLVAAKRIKAIKLGAIEVDFKHLVNFMEEHKK